MKQIIYVALLDEGTPCWRPVEALHKYHNVYTLIQTNLNPEDERWEFRTGDEVRCESHTASDGSVGLRAYAKVSE